MSTTRPRTVAARSVARMALVATIAALSVAGCSSDTGTTTPQVSVTPSGSVTESGPTPSGGPTGAQPTTAPSGTTTRDNVSLLTRAGKAAHAKSPSSTLTAIDLQTTEQGGSIWEVTLVSRVGDQQDIQLTADGSKVTYGPTGEAQTPLVRSVNLALVKGVSVTYAHAVEKLPKSVKGGRITQLDLKLVSGRPVWEATMTDVGQTLHQIQISAETGKVLLDQT